VKKTILAALTVAVLTTGPAAAQQHPPIFNWTGFYVGIDAGHVWTYSRADYDLAPDYYADNSGNGALLGLHFGYRHQLPSNFVVGLEGDIWGAFDAKSTVSLVVPAANWVNFHTTAGASVRGTAGYAMANFLIYATGGAAFLAYQGCTSVNIATTACNINPGAGLDTRFKDVAVGWTLGIGAAYAIRSNLIARFEYLYADYGTIRNITQGLGNGYTDTEINSHVARVSLSWKFAN
jgi:outer membrane immunogenic protein